MTKYVLKTIIPEQRFKIKAFLFILLALFNMLITIIWSIDRLIILNSNWNLLRMITLYLVNEWRRPTTNWRIFQHLVINVEPSLFGTLYSTKRHRLYVAEQCSRAPAMEINPHEIHSIVGTPLLRAQTCRHLTCFFHLASWFCHFHHAYHACFQDIFKHLYLLVAF